MRVPHTFVAYRALIATALAAALITCGFGLGGVGPTDDLHRLITFGTNAWYDIRASLQ